VLPGLPPADVLRQSLELNRERSGGYDLLFLALCRAGEGDAAAAHRDFCNPGSQDM
jgi:hypothetical protein